VEGKGRSCDEPEFASPYPVPAGICKREDAHSMMRRDCLKR
jgi:hypothetical protein